MTERENSGLRPLVYAGPISYLIGLLVTLFLLTAWFDEAQRRLLRQAAARGAPAASSATELAAAYKSLENAGGFGIVAGLALAFLVWHPRRVLGLVPWASTAWAITLLLLFANTLNLATAFICGLCAGLTAWPLMMTALRRSGLTGPFPARDRTWLLVLIPVGLTVGLMLRATLNRAETDTRDFVLLAMSLGGALLAWGLYLQNALEVLLEILLLPMYRFSFHGPGVHSIPATGPLLLIANHSSMLDPLFIGKVAPRRIIPVMGAKYYDLPVLRFLMRRVVGTIRVPEAERRTEAPELEQVVDALDKGHCVLFFPEGRLRRAERPELEYFNQGVWRVLTERPQTPVVAFWIEGAWGSYLSYKDGPPGTNKRWDWLRPIRIVVAEPEVLPAEILATHQATRHYLTNKVADLRRQVAGHPALQYQDAAAPAERAPAASQ